MTKVIYKNTHREILVLSKNNFFLSTYTLHTLHQLWTKCSLWEKKKKGKVMKDFYFCTALMLLVLHKNHIEENELNYTETNNAFALVSGMPLDTKATHSTNHIVQGMWYWGCCHRVRAGDAQGGDRLRWESLATIFKFWITIKNKNLVYVLLQELN